MMENISYFCAWVMVIYGTVVMALTGAWAARILLQQPRQEATPRRRLERLRPARPAEVATPTKTQEPDLVSEQPKDPDLSSLCLKCYRVSSNPAAVEIVDGKTLATHYCDECGHVWADSL
jgi:hypothetical protein